MHTCDVRNCVRNDEPGTYLVNGKLLPRFGHLVLGTLEDNNADTYSKGRWARTSHPHKLTDAIVSTIRARYAAGGIYQRELAAEYGVNQALISRILSREVWRDAA